MYFEINKKTYGIKFRYMGTTTYAELVEVNDEGIVHLGIFGIARLYYKDTFVKSVGRKVALTNLLAALSDHDIDFPDFLLNKNTRALIWKAYFESGAK